MRTEPRRVAPRSHLIANELTLKGAEYEYLDSGSGQVQVRLLDLICVCVCLRVIFFANVACVFVWVNRAGRHMPPIKLMLAGLSAK